MSAKGYWVGLLAGLLLAVAGCSGSCTKCAQAGSTGGGGAGGEGTGGTAAAGTGGGCAGTHGLGGGGFADAGERLACAAPPCASPACDPTWAAALADPQYCRRDALGYSSTGTCTGGVTILVKLMESYELDCYYDASGAIVAGVSLVVGTGPSCVYGPAEGFVPPDCPTGGRAPFSDRPICSADAGTNPG